MTSRALAFALVLASGTAEAAALNGIGGTGMDYGNAVAVTPGGRTWLVGEFQDTITVGAGALTAIGSVDTYLIRAVAGGGVERVLQLGGTAVTRAEAAAAMPDGGVVVAGHFTGTLDLGGSMVATAQGVDGFVVRYTGSGVPVWLGTVSSTGYEASLGVAAGPDGEVVVVGHTQGVATVRSSAGAAVQVLPYDAGSDGFVAAFDSAGRVDWTEGLNGPGFDYAWDVDIDLAGRVYLTGCFSDGAVLASAPAMVSAGSYDVFLARFDGAGSLDWLETAGGVGQDEARGIDVTGSGEITLAGFFEDEAFFDVDSVTSAGGEDGFVARYDADGFFGWVTRVGGADDERLYNVAATGLGAASAVGRQGTDGLVLKLTPVGAIGGTFTFGGPSIDQANDVAWDRIHARWIFTGEFADTATFGPRTLISNGSFDAFVGVF